MNIQVIPNPSPLPTCWKLVSSVFSRVTVLAATLALFGGQFSARAQWDNWDDGDDMSPPVLWGHLDPIFDASGGVSIPNVYDASSGSYHLIAVPGTSGFGNPRTLALPTNSASYVYSDFYVSVDVVAWSLSTAQAFGLGARVSDLGAGTTDGYAFGLACGGAVLSGQNYIRILRLENEATKDVLGSGPTGTSVVPIPDLIPGTTYRLVFMGRGTDLEGRLYQLPNLTTPIAAVSGNTAGDSIILTNGYSGLLAFGLNENLAADVTFDNYYASKRVPLKITDMVVKDNFNDGNDTAPTMNWDHYDPIYLAGQGQLPPQDHWFFPSGAYRLTADPSPDPGTLGAARVGSLDATPHTDFRISIDLVGFDPNVNNNMAVGLLARVTNPGPGSTDGYGMTFQTQPNQHDIDLIRIHGEQPDGPGAENFRLDSDDSLKDIDFTTNTVRMVFVGQGNQLRGLVFKLPETMNPLVDCMATDTNLPLYTAGISAVFGFDNGGLTGVDVTFDNYSDTPIVPPAVVATIGAANTGEVNITWPGNAEGVWVLQSSSSVSPGAVWTQVATTTTTGLAGKIIYNPATGKNTYTGSLPMAATGSTFYRLKQM